MHQCFFSAAFRRGINSLRPSGTTNRAPKDTRSTTLLRSHIPDVDGGHGTRSFGLMTHLNAMFRTALLFAGANLQVTGALVAQTRATATNVPVIPHQAVPDFFKNPPGIYTG